MKVSLAPQVEKRIHSSDANRNANTAHSEGPPLSIGYDYRDFRAKFTFDEIPNSGSARIGVIGQSRDMLRVDIRVIDAGIRADEAVLGARNYHVPKPHDFTGLLQNYLNLAWILVKSCRYLFGLFARLYLAQVDNTSLRLRNYRLRDDENISVLQAQPLFLRRVHDEFIHPVALFHHRQPLERDELHSATHGYFSHAALNPKRVEMKFGVEFVPYLKLDALVKLARLVERSGFKQIWVCDHYHNRYIYPVLTQLALETRQVKLGPGVTNPYLVHPTVTAAAVATLNEISRGRALLGISAGDPFFLATVGIEQRKPVTAVREAVHIVRELLAGNRVSFEGELFSCRNAGLRFKPEDKIPVYIGGRRRRMLELAGSVADGAHINASHPDDIQESIRYIERGLRSSGRDPKTFDFVAYLVVSVGGDLKRARDVVRGVVSFVTSSAPRASLDSHGIEVEKVESIRRLLRVGELKKARATVTERMIDAFSVCGTVDELAARIEELKRLGITRTVMGSPMGPEPARAVRSIAKALL